MRKFNKNIILIIISCFWAETFFSIVRIIFILAIYNQIGFEDYKIKKSNVLGCLPEVWMWEVLFLSFIAYKIFFFTISYFFNRKFKKDGNKNWLILGAFSFYPILNFCIFHFFSLLRYNPFWFWAKKDSFLLKKVSIFGNFYYLKYAELISVFIFFIISLLAIYLITFKVWDKEIRIKYLLFGSVSCIAGWLFWFFVLGKYFEILFV
jgi:hypothetical protein